MVLALKRSPGQVGAYVVVAGWSLLLAVILMQLFHGHGFDDPYITYRYAVNLAHGNGFVYNVGSRILSTTTPLYTLLLVPFAWLGLDLPSVSNGVGCLSLGLGALAFWELGRTTGLQRAGVACLLLYPISPLLLPTLGAESALYCALILWGFVWYVQEGYRRAAVVLALAILTRADALLMVVVLVCHWMAVRRGRVPWQALLLGAGLTLPWLAWAWWYFGAPLPVTLAAKQQQGRLPSSVHILAGLVFYARVFGAQPLYRFYAIVGVVGLVYGVGRKQAWLLLPLWNVLYVVAYNALGVSRYFWYYAPLSVGVIAVVGLGVEAGGRLLERARQSTLVVGGVVVLMLVLTLTEAVDLPRAVRQVDSRVAIYRRVGEWLQVNTPPTADVGTLEVGIIGFYSQRTIIDFGGLLQPETALQLGPASSYEDAARWAIARFRPQYLVVQHGGFPRLVQDPLVTACVRRIQFADPAYAGVIDVYSCGATPH